MDISTQIDWMSITYPSDIALSNVLPFDYRIKPCKSPIPVYPVGFETFPHRAKILVSPLDRQGKHVILSGKTMQMLYDDDISPLTIYRHVTAHNGKLSRIDLALDIFDIPEFTVRRFEQQLPNADTKLIGHKYIGSQDGLETCYLGNMKSKSRRFRCYDKAVESKLVDLVWVRMEYEKRRGANVLAKRIFFDDVSISSIIKGVIDFPNWKLYQDIINCEKAPTFRGENNPKDEDWRKTLQWLLDSASVCLANCTYDEYLAQLTPEGSEWSIDSSIVLNEFSSVLAAHLRNKFDTN